MQDQSNNTSSNNKRIAKNTAYLYVRMFISMAVSLYSSRVILQILGIEDYGVYNIVGGVVTMFSFINSTMSSATSRFLTFELGRGIKETLRDTFNAAFWVHVIIAVIILVLCETIGLWFLHYKMVIPQGREFATNIVFQLSILATIVSILQVPYNASLIAHEKMDIYAYVEMVNAFLRLGILYVLVIVNMDKLILYGILTLAVSSGTAFYYCHYAGVHYEECRISKIIQWDIIKPMLAFSGWDFYGNMAVTARTQGVSMLLNVFFGPVMNAAAGIATSVQTAVMSFANNVNTAVKPQIIKYYAQKDYQHMESLINNACKLNFLVLALIIIPLSSEIDYILQLWLGEVPEMVGIFCTLTLSFNLFANISFLVNTGNHASGRIFRPSIINGTLYLLVVPFSYISFKLGGGSWTAYVFNIGAVILGMLSNAYTLHLNVPDYSLSRFLKDVITKCLLTIIIGIVTAYLVRLFFPSTFVRVVIVSLLTNITMGLFGWYFMVPKNLRQQIINKIRISICKKA